MYQMIHCDMAKFTTNLENALVVDFLLRFKAFASRDGLVIFQRKNYLKTLAELGMMPSESRKIIVGLTPAAYYKGVGPGERADEEVCEFGVLIGGIEVYIKLLIDTKREKAICFSFHAAERKILYPFAEDVS